MTRSLLLLLLCGCMQPALAQPVRITVDAAGHPRHESIVQTQVKPGALRSTGSYRAVNERTGRSAPVQHGPDGTVAFILPDALGANDKASYQLVRRKAAAQPVSMESSAQGVQVKVRGRPVLFYQAAVRQPPAPMSEVYARSGFIHPVRSPAGTILTDDFPVGHAHQHGIMLAWTSTTFKNAEHDFWNRHRKLGNIQHVKVESIEPGPVLGTMKVRLQHTSPAHGVVLDETWTITVYPFERYFLFDLQSDQKNTSTEPLVLNKYHYGGAGFRASKHWNPDDDQHVQGRWQLMTDTDATPERTNGKPAAWVSVAGVIDGATAGVTVFGFPDNYNYPQPIRAHPTMPYFSFSPTVEQGFSIQPGASYRSRFRYLVHDGAPDKAFIGQLNTELLHPVKTSVTYR